MFRRPCLLALFFYTVVASMIAKAPASSHAEGYQVVHIYPHDPQAFTQGLICVDGHLYESTGLNGRSSIRMVDLSTGQVLQKYDLPPGVFW
jgi:glutaminyl-peptide cyclotransferase